MHVYLMLLQDDVGRVSKRELGRLLLHRLGRRPEGKSEEYEKEEYGNEEYELADDPEYNSIPSRGRPKQVVKQAMRQMVKRVDLPVCLNRLGKEQEEEMEQELEQKLEEGEATCLPFVEVSQEMCIKVEPP